MTEYSMLFKGFVVSYVTVINKQLNLLTYIEEISYYNCPLPASLPFLYSSGTAILTGIRRRTDNIFGVPLKCPLI